MATSVMGATGFDDGAGGISVPFGAFVCFFEESSETAKLIISCIAEVGAVELVHQVSAEAPQAEYSVVESLYEFFRPRTYKTKAFVEVVVS